MWYVRWPDWHEGKSHLKGELSEDQARAQALAALREMLAGGAPLRAVMRLLVVLYAEARGIPLDDRDEVFSLLKLSDDALLRLQFVQNPDFTVEEIGSVYE